ncbi:MAG: dTDP-4-dehydrorhamnose 3,5-epimerase [Hyphomicrobiaceae bacterium]|nr:dTDP-4-dehydrorhamnose 3,5-epimerase [Hyphomicrobiaceae bacterium]
MEVTRLALADVLLLQPVKHGDERGFFSETYNKAALEEHGLKEEFVQDNHSLSKAKGVLRGLHFQLPPHAQGKLVRVVRGSVFDVAVDIRRGSPTFGQHVSAVLSAKNWHQLWIPKGFAHGFLTLEADTEFVYKVTGKYAPEYDRGLIWNDPELAIDWPIEEALVQLSEKDRQLPRLLEATELFEFDKTLMA